MFQSAEIIGRNQYDFAKNLYDQASEEVTGKVDYRLSYLDMPTVEVLLLLFRPPPTHFLRLLLLMVPKSISAKLLLDIPSLLEQLMAQE